ncbi:MAG: hypothetical protein ACE5HO_04245 [bacterium]
MPKSCVLISGPTISLDEHLFRELQKHVITLKCGQNNEIVAVLETAEIAILVLEMTSATSADLDIIKTIKSHCQKIEIILIGGNDDRNIIAKAFALGAKDAFPKAFDRSLLVERIQALLRQI